MSDKGMILSNLKKVALTSTNPPHPVKEKEKWAAYIELLSVYPEEVLEKAFLIYFRTNTSPYFPSLGDLNSFIQKAYTDDIPPKEEAWGDIQSKISAYGRLNKPDIPPFLEKVIESVGGWSYLCKSTNVVSDRSNFYKNYDSLKERHVEETMLNV